MSWVRVAKNGLATMFDTDEQGRLMFDGNIFTSVAVTEIDRGYRITVTDADHPNGASYDIADNGLIIVASAADIAALSDIDECLILAQNEIVDDGRTFYAGLLRKVGQNITQISRFTTTVDIDNWNDANEKKHWHQNNEELVKIGEDANGNMTYGENTLAKQSDVDDAVSDLENAISALSSPDTLVPLSLGVTYNELVVRSDWQDVPVYIIGDNPVVCRLASDSSVGGFAESEIRLMYLVDYSTGMPCPALSVTSGGSYLTYFPVTYHAMGKTLSAGWYDVNDDPVQGTPTFTNMVFDRLVIGSDEPIRDLSGLSDEAQCALDTLSRMVNVSVDAMGTRGEKPDGVQRLHHAPQIGRRYAAVTGRDITFPLPAIPWTGAERDFWVDLDCTSSVNLTFSQDVCYEDGNNIDTTRGRHRLHFYAPAGASVWTVAETESVSEVTEDVLPEYAVPFRSLSADQLRAVIKFGYANADGDWCVRLNGVETPFLSVGDLRPVTLTDGQEVTMRIIGIRHDDIPNVGKAALTCDFKETVSVPTYSLTFADYTTSALRSGALSLLDKMPTWLREMVVKVEKQYNVNGYSVTDEIWAFSASETGLEVTANQEGIGTAYPFFTDNRSRQRKKASDGTYTAWKLRTLQTLTVITSACQDQVSSDGSAGMTQQPAFSPQADSVAVGFCLNA